MLKLKEKHILNKGGVHYTDSYGVKWIDLQKGEDARSKLRFYNYGNGFNVYLVSSEDKTSIQLTTISKLLKFKMLYLSLDN